MRPDAPNANEIETDHDQSGGTQYTRRRFLMAAGGVAMTAAIASCGGGGNTRITGGGGGRSRNTLVFAATGTPESIDAEFNASLGSNDAYGALYDYLVAFRTEQDAAVASVLREDLSLDPSRAHGGWALEGRLAESWELSRDGRVATFNLRQGVMSNWGNELTAEDVKWSWDRRFALNSISSFFINVLGLEGPKAVKVEDRYVVSFTSKEPTALALTVHGNLLLPVLDATKLRAVHRSGDKWGQKFLRSQSAGFGPYRLKTLVQGERAVYEARDDYWGERPRVRRVIYRQVPSSSDRVALLRRGEVDVAMRLLPRELDAVKGASGVRVDSVDGTQINRILLNAKSKPFDDARVRQAMNYVFPQADALKAVYGGYAKASKTLYPPAYPFADESAYSYGYDPDRARELLRAAGADKLSTTLTYNAEEPAQEDVALLFQESLKDIGVTLELDKLPGGPYFEAVSKRSRPMLFHADAPWNPDPGYSTYLYLNSESFVNYSNYSNKRVDMLTTEGLSIQDLDRRQSIYEEVQRIAVGESPWVFGVNQDFALAVADRVDAWTYYTTNAVRFQDFQVA